jgi:ribonucleoside-diphosphate reductase alpha chain
MLSAKNNTKNMDRGALPKQIQKRDGSLSPFNSEKIEQAVQGAAYEILQNRDRAELVARRVTSRVLEIVSERCREAIPAVESIQDLVEAALMREGYSYIARTYILYRQERSEIRRAKEGLGVKDDLKLPALPRGASSMCLYSLLPLDGRGLR